MNMKEITFELTNYCMYTCSFCSSNITNNYNEAKFISIDFIRGVLEGLGKIDRINLSGGEPLAHPHFFNIFMLCKKYADLVPVYSNLITYRVYNGHAIDGVYLVANINVTPETNSIHILRRVKQGKELNRPEVHLSKNHHKYCLCDHNVYLPTEEKTLTPCNKDNEMILQRKLENKYYVVGAHGVGKTTLIKDYFNIFNTIYYENESKNPFIDDIRKRQLWRLMKYVFDKEMINSYEKHMLINRCHIDWLVYTETFKKLGWLNDKDYEFLISKYEELFSNELPENIIYVNPDVEWSKERILERGMVKWREEDFTYYIMLRNMYDDIIGKISSITNVIEINEMKRKDRVNILNEKLLKVN